MSDPLNHVEKGYKSPNRLWKVNERKKAIPKTTMQNRDKKYPI